MSAEQITILVLIAFQVGQWLAVREVLSVLDRGERVQRQQPHERLNNRPRKRKATKSLRGTQKRRGAK